MRSKINSLLKNIHPSVYLCLAIAVLLLPVQWVTAWVIASIVHEMGHYYALRLCGCNIQHIQLDINSAKIQAGQMDWTRQLFCQLAGPLCGLLLVFLGRWVPRVAVCAFMQSMYNLLPLTPLDGGKIMQILFRQLISKDHEDRIIMVVEKIFLTAMGILCIWLSVFRKMGVLPIIVFFILLLKNRKIPCKPGLMRVQ